MNQLLKAGIIFAIGLILIDNFKKGGDANGQIHAVERNADTRGDRGFAGGERATDQGHNWNSVNTEQFI